MTAGYVVLPAVVDHRRPVLERLFGIEHRREHLVLHFDEIEGPLGCIDVDRGDRGDPVSDVAGLVGEDELVLVLALVGERWQTLGHHRTGEAPLGNVIVGDDRCDTRKRLSFGDIYLGHPGVSVGAHEDAPDEHAR